MKNQHKNAAFVLAFILLFACLFPVSAFGASSGEGRYYSQLDADAKTIYNALCALTPQTLTACEKTADGAYIYKVEKIFPLELTKSVGSGGVTSSIEFAPFYRKLATSLYAALAAFNYDKPAVFWLDKQMEAGFLYLRKNSLRYDFSVILYPKVHKAYEKGLSSAQSKFSTAMNGFSATGGTRYEKLKSIYDYLCDTVRYVDSNTTEHSAYGALVDKAAVCEGYARAFKALCDREGIPCVLVSGQGVASSIESHMWNYVQMEDGDWYAIDVTWGDQDGGAVLYDYFLAGADTLCRGSQTRTFSQSHLSFNVISTCTIISGSRSETIEIQVEYPEISRTAYAAEPPQPQTPSDPGEITIIFAGNHLSLDNENRTVRNVAQKQRVSDFIQNYASLSLEVLNIKGQKLNANDYVGTGTEVHVYSGTRHIGYYTVIVNGDVDGDAAITAADARTALRASAGLIQLQGAPFSAADVENISAVRASSARKILRISAKLENFSYT
ncbi:MAG: hypothetical protein LBS36_04095 [Oscillospiraceae bacterium]|jgi:hypothetical protein|nr:hypothetical protein [Oscillospiraceae bacterium]